MKTRFVTLGIAVGVLVLVTVSSFADLGVADKGKSGKTVIHIASVDLQVKPSGEMDKLDCSMPTDNTTYNVSSKAGKVDFVIHYKFVNQREALSQRFTTGFKVEKKQGSGWTTAADSARSVDKTVKAKGETSGDATISTQSLSGSTTFKITVKYEIYGVKEDSTTRTITVTPGSQP